MKQTGSKHRSFVGIAIVTAFMILAAPLVAQQNDLAAGRMAGSQAAKADTNGTAWLTIGCVCACLGVGAAYILDPEPPITALLGKSPEYVAAYTDGYKQATKGTRTGRAQIGCVVGTLLYATALYFWLK